METITWLTSGSYVDYRPVFSPDGSSILFERSPLGTKDQQVLYLIPAAGGTPSPFLVDPPSNLGAQTRPDWSSAGVAFSGNGGPIHLADSDGTNIRTLSGTSGMIYPAWYLTEWLAVMFDNGGQPYTVKINPSSGQNLGRLSPSGFYAGMPSISQQTSPVLAFAGQPAQGKYDQDNNQIYLSTSPSSPPTLLDGKQGRAPWWSANGQVLAFESNRAAGGYAIFSANPDGSNEVQLTDTQYNAQHPKFSPDGTTIVFAAQPNGTGPGKEWAIATIPFNP